MWRPSAVVLEGSRSPSAWTSHRRCRTGAGGHSTQLELRTRVQRTRSPTSQASIRCEKGQALDASTNDHAQQTTSASHRRRRLTGGLVFVLGTFLTFAQFSGSRQGDTGLLFSPDAQHAKVIAVWKEIEPLPRVIVQRSIILAGMVIFAIAYAFQYRSIAAAWPTGMTNRTWRLASIVWVAAVSRTSWDLSMCCTSRCA